MKMRKRFLENCRGVGETPRALATGRRAVLIVRLLWARPPWRAWPPGDHAYGNTQKFPGSHSSRSFNVLRRVPGVPGRPAGDPAQVQADPARQVPGYGFRCCRSDLCTHSSVGCHCPPPSAGSVTSGRIAHHSHPSSTSRARASRPVQTHSMAS